MSRNAHAQNPCKLRKLPRCSKCKIEFVLVAAYYEGIPKAVEEWECPKCKKTVAKERLKEEPLSDWESFLKERVKDINDERTRNC